MAGRRWFALGLVTAVLLAGACGGADEKLSEAGKDLDDGPAGTSQPNVGGGEEALLDARGSGSLARKPEGPDAPATGGGERAAAAINPFLPTATDPLSTFALDVDTGSYTVARRSLGLDQRPPAETVRPEEFVNYFEQDYPAPDGTGFRITVDGAPTPFVQGSRHHLVRVGLQTRKVEPEDRKAAVLTFVIDVSGSMADPGKLDLVKESLTLLLDQLRPSDRVGIVVYGDTARVLQEPVAVGDKTALKRAIGELRPEGSTNVEAGLKEGYAVARRAFTDGAINRVVLLSDGVANVGATGPEAILAQIEEQAGKGIQLATIGFGIHFNDRLMERLADQGDGFYAYVDDRREAERLFLRHLTSTLETQAIDAKAQVELDPRSVVRYRLVGFDNRLIADEDFEKDGVDAGEIGAGHSVTALYEVELAPTATTIGSVRVRWNEPGSGTSKEVSASLPFDAVASSFDKASPRFQLDAVAAAFAEVLRGSDHAKHLKLADIATEAKRVATLLPNDAAVQELAKLVGKAAAISG